MRSTKLKAAAFIIANILVIFLLHFLLSSPSRVRIIMNEFRQGQYSTIILGQSHAATAVNPFLLDEGAESQAFSFARLQTPYRNFYYTILEADSEHKLKRVFFEIDSFYLCSDGLERQVGNGNNIFGYLSPRVQLDYLWNVLFRQDYNQAVFDYRLTTDGIKNMKNRVKIKSGSNYLKAIDPEAENEMYGDYYQYQGRGFVRGLSTNGVKYEPTQFVPSNVQSTALDYLKKSAEYCRENEIEMICFISALPPYRLLNENHGEVHDYVSEFCRQNDIRFIDANYIKYEYLHRKDSDYVDLDGHMMGDLADRQTQILKEIADSTEPQGYFEKSYRDVLNSVYSESNLKRS